jgi:hypothetical protein
MTGFPRRRQQGLLLTLGCLTSEEAVQYITHYQTGGLGDEGHII